MHSIYGKRSPACYGIGPHFGARHLRLEDLYLRRRGLCLAC